MNSKIKLKKIVNKLLHLWVDEFESSKSWQNNISERYLNIVFPIGISFPFGLYFLKNPSSINWDIDHINIKEIISNFLDSKAYIINDFDVDSLLQGKALNIPNTPLKLTKQSPIQITHCIDNKLDTKNEINSWTYDEFINPIGYVRTKAELVSHLKHDNFPRIVHFSSHYEFSTEDDCYKLTLTEPDFITKKDIRRLKKLEENQLPALFFY